jgi:hypothetical protein
MEPDKANIFRAKVDEARSQGRSLLADIRSIVAEKLRG